MDVDNSTFKRSVLCIGYADVDTMHCKIVVEQRSRSTRVVILWVLETIVSTVKMVTATPTAGQGKESNSYEIPSASRG